MLESKVAQDFDWNASSKTTILKAEFQHNIKMDFISISSKDWNGNEFGVELSVSRISQTYSYARRLFLCLPVHYT
jgi:hypothetical protein